jgi:alpha-beta hydrolase superfamily lysophospholipase
MSVWQSKAMDVISNIFPMIKITPESLNISPSDNLNMLELLRDPALYINQTRLDSIYGHTNLMDQTLEASNYQRKPLLVLYGAKDDLAPKFRTCKMLSKPPQKKPKRWRVVFYPNGYHLLSRDLDRSVVIRDIKTWTISKEPIIP